MSDIKVKIEPKFGSKYKKVPNGCRLESFDDDYGIVSNNNGYYLINSQGEFVKGPFEYIRQIENNCYLYQNGDEGGVVENGEVIKIADECDDFNYLGDDLFCIHNLAQEYLIIRKDGQHIVKDISATYQEYQDGKIFYQKDEDDNTVYIVSKDGKKLGSLNFDFNFFFENCKDGNCLIWNFHEKKHYGFDLETKKLTEINGKLYGLKHDGAYYVFKDGMYTILDSKFNILKDDITSDIIDVKDGQYLIYNREGKKFCIMDFDDNILYDHVKWIKDGVMQIGDDKIYDSVNKREYNLPSGLNVLSLNRDSENNNLLFKCRDDSGFVHLSDFDTIDIDIGLDSDITSENKCVVFGSKYVVINDCIIPNSDLKNAKSIYEYEFEINGESFKKQFDTRKETDDFREKMEKAISLLNQERDDEIYETVRAIDNEYGAKKLELVRKNMN